MHPYGFGGARRECLDRLLIVGRRHLESVIKGYSRHYNEHGPHRSLGQRPPISKLPPGEPGMANVIDLDCVRRRYLLVGLIREYRVGCSASARRSLLSSGAHFLLVTRARQYQIASRLAWSA